MKKIRLYLAAFIPLCLTTAIYLTASPTIKEKHSVKSRTSNARVSSRNIKIDTPEETQQWNEYQLTWKILQEEIAASDWHDAERNSRRLLSSHFSTPADNVFLAKTFFMQGRYSESVSAYRKALNRQPRFCSSWPNYTALAKAFAPRSMQSESGAI